jgi:DNA-binding NarL/FixJ family response regulator
MTRAIIIADSGPVFASLTEHLLATTRAEIVRHASGRVEVEAQVRSFTPDLVLLHDMGLPLRALARVQEIRRAAPDAVIVLLAERPEASWLGQALRLGATATMPADSDATIFERILTEVSGDSLSLTRRTAA